MIPYISFYGKAGAFLSIAEYVKSASQTASIRVTYVYESGENKERQIPLSVVQCTKIAYCACAQAR